MVISDVIVRSTMNGVKAAGLEHPTPQLWMYTFYTDIQTFNIKLCIFGRPFFRPYARNRRQFFSGKNRRKHRGLYIVFLKVYLYGLYGFLFEGLCQLIHFQSQTGGQCFPLQPWES